MRGMESRSEEKLKSKSYQLLVTYDAFMPILGAI